MAHRGASAGAPENTLPAFELAWAYGADAIEGDFHLTADGKIVCIHDDDTEYAAGVMCVVRKSMLTELLELDVGARVGRAVQRHQDSDDCSGFCCRPSRQEDFYRD